MQRNKIIFTLLTALLSTFAFAQTGSFNPVRGKQDFKDSLRFSNLKNNIAGDSVLSTDTKGNVIQILKSTGGGLTPADTVGRWVGSIYKRADSFFYKKGITEFFAGLDISGGLQPGSELDSGGVITQTGLFDINVTAAFYHIAGAAYSSANTDLSLSPPDEFSYIAAVVVDTFGVVYTIAGPESTNPFYPNIPPYVLPIGFVLVAPGGITPLPTKAPIWRIAYKSDSVLQFTRVGFPPGINDTFLLQVFKTIYERNDSIFYVINQTEHFAFIRNGSATNQNFANTDLTATGDRLHNFEGHSLDIITGGNEIYQDTTEVSLAANNPATAVKSKFTVKDDFIQMHTGDGLINSKIVTTRDSITLTTDSTNGHYHRLLLSNDSAAYKFSDEDEPDSNFVVHFPKRFGHRDTLATLDDVRNSTGGSNDDLEIVTGRDSITSHGLIIQNAIIRALNGGGSLYWGFKTGSGTDPGDGSTGINVIGIGPAAATGVSANGVFGAGFQAVRNVTGLGNVIGIGTGALSGNSAADVNGFGFNVGINNSWDNVNLFGNLATADSSFQTVFSNGIRMGRFDFGALSVNRKWRLPNADGRFTLSVAGVPADVTGNIPIQLFDSTLYYKLLQVDSIAAAIRAEIIAAGYITGAGIGMTKTGTNLDLGGDLQGQPVDIRDNATGLGIKIDPVTDRNILLGVAGGTQLNIAPSDDYVDASGFGLFKIGTFLSLRNVQYEMPSADGSAGDVLSTNGSGVWQWAPPAAGGSGINQVIAGLWLNNVDDSTIKADSAAMAGYFLRRKDSTNANGYITPTALNARGYTTNTGTLTTITRTNAYGITVTITSPTTTPNITALFDSSTVFNRARVIIDSIVTTKGYLLPADTANKWVGSMYKRADSVFYKTGSTEHFAFKDSSGGSGTAADSLQTVRATGVYVDTVAGLKYLKGDTVILATRYYVDSIANLMLRKANNLSDLASPSTARANLGLGTLATQSGTFSGTSSGTNTGDQTITLTGPVTGTGTGSFVTTITASGVTAASYDKATVTVGTDGRITAAANGESDLIEAYAALGSTIVASPVGLSSANITTSMGLSDGGVNMVAVWLSTPRTLTGVKWYQTAQGSYTGDNENRIGLYTLSGSTFTLVASTTNDAALWSTFSTSQTGNKAFTSTYAAARGLYFVGVLYNQSAQTTSPTIGCAPVAVSTNAQKMDFANNVGLSFTVTGNNTLPSSISMASGTLITNRPLLFLY